METLDSNNYYHIYNHIVGEGNLFQDDNDYLFFLKQMEKYLFPVSDIVTYCLMPNHFHIIIKPRDIDLTKFSKSGLVVSKRLSHLFNSYAQAYNKKYQRRVSLFMRPFKRKRVVNEEYLKKLVHYIHYNPVESGFVIKVDQWRFSSYNSYVSQDSTLISKDYIISLFNDVDNFKYCHTISPNISGID